MTPTFSQRVTAGKWQAVVFDLDDTLYPECDYVLSGFRAVAEWAERTQGLLASQTFSELKFFFHEGVRGDTFDRWLQKHRLDPALAESMVGVYREHSPVLELFPGARELLILLRKFYRLGLISDGYLEVQQKKFAALDLQSLFEVVIFSDQWGRAHWKPSVKPFQTAATLLGLEPSRIVYVADNPAKDFLGARRLGIFTVRLQTEGSEYARLLPASEAHTPDRTVTSLKELQSILVT